MNTKHTPGPWTIADAKGTLCASKVIASGKTVAFVGQTGSNDMDDANARLIAAAPELLAACVEMLAYAESVGLGDSGSHRSAKAVDGLAVAIAKAKNAS